MFWILHNFLITALVSLEPSSWEELKFENVPPNRVSFRESALTIEVKESASPLINIFPASKTIRRIEVSGAISGNPNWSLTADDALLRVGVIQEGEKRLNALQKLAAPDWLQRVDKLVGTAGRGVDSILCYHLTPNANRVGHSQTNPNASIFKETIQASPESDGTFQIVVEFSDPISSPGLWLLADGDDSGSSFEVRIESIVLTE